MAGNSRIAPTAHVTAQTWRRAGFPGAEAFDTWTGRVGYDALRLGLMPMRWLGQPAGHFLAFLRLRHHWIGQCIRQQSPNLLFDVGAGLSARGLTLARAFPAMRVVEADLPGMVAAKRRRLAGVALPANYRLVPADLLADDFGDSLRTAAGHSRGGAMAITEGVTDYLGFDDKPRAWSNLHGLLAGFGGGTYLTDINPRARARSLGVAVPLFLQMLGRLTGGDFGDRLFEHEQAAAVALEQAGFTDVQVVDVATLDNGGLPMPGAGRFFELLKARVTNG